MDEVSGVFGSSVRGEVVVCGRSGRRLEFGGRRNFESRREDLGLEERLEAEVFSSREDPPVEMELVGQPLREFSGRALQTGGENLAKELREESGGKLCRYKGRSRTNFTASKETETTENRVEDRVVSRVKRGVGKAVIWSVQKTGIRDKSYDSIPTPN